MGLTIADKRIRCFVKRKSFSTKCIVIIFLFLHTSDKQRMFSSQARSTIRYEWHLVGNCLTKASAGWRENRDPLFGNHRFEMKFWHYCGRVDCPVNEHIQSFVRIKHVRCKNALRICDVPVKTFSYKVWRNHVIFWLWRPHHVFAHKTWVWISFKLIIEYPVVENEKKQTMEMIKTHPVDLHKGSSTNLLLLFDNSLNVLPLRCADLKFSFFYTQPSEVDIVLDEIRSRLHCCQ